MAKSIMLLVLGIDNLIGNSRAILPLLSFSLGLLIFYNYFNSHLFFKSNDLRQLFLKFNLFFIWIICSYCFKIKLYNLNKIKSIIKKIKFIII